MIVVCAVHTIFHRVQSTVLQPNTHVYRGVARDSQGSSPTRSKVATSRWKRPAQQFPGRSRFRSGSRSSQSRGRSSWFRSWARSAPSEPRRSDGQRTDEGDQVGNRIGSSWEGGPCTPHPLRGTSACTVPGPDSAKGFGKFWTKPRRRYTKKRANSRRESGGWQLFFQEAEVSPAAQFSQPPPTVPVDCAAELAQFSVCGRVEGGKERFAFSIGQCIFRTRRTRTTEAAKDPRRSIPRSGSAESEWDSVLFFRDVGDHDRQCFMLLSEATDLS